MTSQIGLSAEKITSYYLYGSEEKPGDLLDPNIVEPRPEPLVTVDVNEYMTNGAGRFASPTFFPVVKIFFEGFIDVPPKINPNTGAIEPYSEPELAALFGVREDITIQQTLFEDNNNDFAERVYIWNATAFDIVDDAQFWVLPDGTKYITDFAVRPFSNDGVENFDFESDSIIAILGNPSLEQDIDPSGIGTKVEIGFTGDLDITAQYSLSDYQNDKATAVYSSISSLASVKSAIDGLVQELFDNGVTKFISDGKAVVFGNLEGETVNLETKINEFHLDAEKNGIIFVGSDNADKANVYRADSVFYGFDGADELNGGSGDDELYGGDKDGLDDGFADTLAGDRGYDTYHANGGDTVTDSDGKGKVYFDGILLTGGKLNCIDGANKSDAEKEWIGSNGEVYTKSGSGLSVEYNGKTLTIADWNKDDLGIDLEESDPRDGDHCDPVPDSYASPLVLDLDGDGIELIALDDSVAFFDIDGDGAAERTAWVSADDGILALDRDGDGAITGAGELFGYGETYSYGSVSSRSGSDFQGPGEIDIRYDSGFDKLAELDLNSDGVIDASDAAYTDLRVWRDLNEDGSSEEDELFTLAEAGVASISLASAAVSETLADSLVTDTALYTTTEGVERDISDIWFRFNQYDVRFDDPEDMDPTLAALPELGGAGAVKDLRLAMAEDPGLRALVEQVTAFDVADLSKLSPLVDEILWRWTGVSESTTAFSRGRYADGRDVEVIEAFSDTPFAQWSGSSPRPFGGAALAEQYDIIHRNVAAQLFAQSTIGQNLFPEITYEQNQFLVLAEGTNSTDLLQRLVDNAPADWSGKIAHFHAGLRLLDTIYKSFDDVKAANDDGAGYRSAVEALLLADGFDLEYLELITAQIGGDGNDSLLTQSVPGNQYERHTHVVTTGAGDDEVYFGGGKAIGYWGEGQGNDAIFITPFEYAIYNAEPRVEIRLPDLTQADISIELGEGWSQDVILRITATGETLTIRDYLLQERASSAAFVFSDGVILYIDDAIAGVAETGTGGDDRLLQVTGTTLDGGTGDDLLLGSDEATTFAFGLGYGHDEIRDIADKAVVNTVVFGPGIAESDLIYGREGYAGQHLTIQIAGTDDILTITDQFGQILPGPSEPAIDRFVFDDGTELTSDQIRAYQLDGGSGDDTLHGEYGPDEFYSFGADGNDVLRGYQGADSYYFFSEYGQDRVEDGGSGGDEDRVIFDLDYSDYTISRVGDVITILDESTGDQVTVDNTKGKVETYVFYDQTIFLDDLITLIDIGSGGTGTEVLGTSAADNLIGTADDEVFVALSGDDTVEGNGGNDELQGGAGADSLNGGENNDTVLGGDDGDYLDGGAGNDYVVGGKGSDTIKGGAGDDLLIDDGDSFENNEFYGGLGNDTLIGEYHYQTFDTYHYDFGDGDDVIIDSSSSFFNSTKTLEFGPGITESDLSYSFVTINPEDHYSEFQGRENEWALRIDIAGGGSLVLATNLYREIGGLETIRFDDGTELVVDTVLAGMRVADDSDQLIVGSGAFGNATLDGGIGNDTLVGTRGATSFNFELGDGQDVIHVDATRSTNGTIFFGPGLEFADLTVSRSGEFNENLIFTFAGGDTVTVVNQYSGFVNGYGEYIKVDYIQSIVFNDGTTWDSAAINAATMPITSGDDHMIGSPLDDSFAASAGDDILEGGSGSDSYAFNIGSGSDTIVETAQGHEYSPFFSDGEGFEDIDLSLLRETDTVTFGAGITINDLTLTTVGDGLQDLQIQINGTDDILLIKDQLFPAGNWGAILDEAQWGDHPDGEVSKEYWDAEFAADYGAAPLFAAGVEKFVFADGTEYTRDEFAAFIGAVENDGDNTIRTDDLGGILDGGAGEDRLEGGAGDDVYKFDTGYFNDVAADAGGNDKVDFGAGIAPEAVAFSRIGENGDDFLIEIGGVERNSLLIEGQFADDGRQIEEFQLSDGSLWSAKDIENYLLFQSITSGSDVITGYEGDDVINARAGDDVIDVRGGDDSVDGGAGRDTVIFQGDRINYDIRVEGDETIVEDIVGNQGLKRLVNVEELEFVSEGGSSEAIELVVNTAPTAGAASFTGREDTTLLLFASELIGNASDADGDGLLLTSVSNAQNGTVELDDSGRVTFIPDADFNGAASFDYTVTDAGGLTSTGTATVQITSVNDAPVVVNAIADQEGTEDQPFSYIVPTDVFSDVDSANLTLSATLNDGSALPAWLTFDGATRTFSGTPPANFNGLLFVSLIASDGEASVSTDFAITINAVNDAPEAVTPLVDVMAAAGESFEAALPTDAFVDVDGDTLLYTAALSDGSALPAWLSIDPLTGAVSGLPAQADAGSYAIDVSASDGLETATSSFNLTIDPNNSAPVVAIPLLDQSSAEDAAFSFVVPVDAFSDAEGDALTLTASLSDGSVLPSWMLFDSATATFSGTPPQDFNTDAGGPLMVTVTASDGSLSVSDGFALAITPVNDAPIGVDDIGFNAAENTTATILAGDLLVNDYDVDGDDLSITAVSTTGTGAVSLNVDGDVVYTPGMDFTGEDSFTYTLSDGMDTSTAIVAVTVNGGTDPYEGWDVGTDGSDVIIGDLFGENQIYGAGGDDILIGGFAADQLDGGSGNDLLLGLGGNDTLNGGTGNDWEFGGTGNDVISGGEGDDYLWGGYGADTFLFTAGSGKDVIMDYSTGSGFSRFFSGGDQITIDVDGISNFDDLLGTASQNGNHLTFDLGNGDELILSNTLLAALDQDAFTFV